MTDMPLYTDTQARDLLEEAIKELGALEKRISALAGMLPTLPADASEGMFVEIGYERWCWTRDVFDPEDLEPGELAPTEIAPVQAYADDWDDMSENGSACWLEYDGQKYVIPDDIEWS